MHSKNKEYTIAPQTNHKHMQEQIEGKTLSLTSPADVMDFGKKLSHYIKENKLSIKKEKS